VLTARDPFGSALRDAQRRTGRKAAPEDEQFLADLAVLYSHLRARAEISPIGGMAARSEIVRRIETRLRVREILESDPRVAEMPVRAPIVVVGLPRTATTLVHRLLSRATTTRAPELWELLRPMTSAADRRRNLREARWLTRLYHWSVPATGDIHPSTATSPEECTFLLPQTLMYEMMGPIPGYRRWYNERDVTPDYEYLRSQLQILQRTDPSRRWVLKSPFHLANLDTLLATFPDAMMVWTSRDPVTTFASWCSLLEANMLMYNKRVDPAEIAQTWLPTWSSALSKARATRRREPGRFLDVAHAEVSDDPVGTTLRLWESLSVDASAESLSRLREEAKRDGRRRPGGHRYELARYGVTEAEVRAALTDASAA
jgi:hypothetical protein